MGQNIYISFAALEFVKLVGADRHLFAFKSVEG
jgi:hypothetical protein